LSKASSAVPKAGLTEQILWKEGRERTGDRRECECIQGDKGRVENMLVTRICMDRLELRAGGQLTAFRWLHKDPLLSERISGNLPRRNHSRICRLP
jgi:hypothetical protein